MITKELELSTAQIKIISNILCDESERQVNEYDTSCEILIRQGCPHLVRQVTDLKNLFADDSLLAYISGVTVTLRMFENADEKKEVQNNG